MPDLSAVEVVSLAAFVGGFTVFGSVLVYKIAYAETFTPVWLERAVLVALNAWDKALIVVADVLLAAALYLNSPKKGATS